MKTLDEIHTGIGTAIDGAGRWEAIGALLWHATVIANPVASATDANVIKTREVYDRLLTLLVNEYEVPE